MPSSSPAMGGVNSKAPLREVRVSEQVVQSCFRHAFTTEKEEVMGMLLGRLETCFFPPRHASTSTAASAASSPLPRSATAVSPDWVEGKVALIWGTHVSERSVQCSDRVEMSPESLAMAAETAERLSSATGTPTTVLGWYHSHPKIPVVPSAVDLGTQREYQQHFESGWVGLIVSVFNTEASLHRSHCALQCFQAGPSNELVEVPVCVVSQAELFPTATAPLLALTDTTPELLRVLHREIRNGVASVESKSRHDPAAMRAARGLADVQLYEVDRLVTEPMRRELESCSLPCLRAEKARLEKKLAELSAAPS